MIDKSKSRKISNFVGAFFLLIVVAILAIRDIGRPKGCTIQHVFPNQFAAVIAAAIEGPLPYGNDLREAAVLPGTYERDFQYFEEFSSLFKQTYCENSPVKNWPSCSVLLYGTRGPEKYYTVLDSVEVPGSWPSGAAAMGVDYEEVGDGVWYRGTYFQEYSTSPLNVIGTFLLASFVYGYVVFYVARTLTYWTLYLLRNKE